jgi:hypothetical protein
MEDTNNGNNGLETTTITTIESSIEPSNSENQPLLPPLPLPSSLSPGPDKPEILKKKKMIKIKIMKKNINNKGTGAGGANTNKNGLKFEEITDFKEMYESIEKSQIGIGSEVTFKGHSRTFIKVSKSALHKYMEKIGEKNMNLKPAAGCKEPDEAYIDPDPERNIVFIIEKKFQQESGSVDEKLQTGCFKQSHYKDLFPNFKIYYMYCLSDWFKRNEYESVLNYLTNGGIPIFWGNSEKEKMIEFIHNPPIL